MAQYPAPKEGIVLTYFIVSGDVERSRRFYTEVLGGETVGEGEPSIVALANGWIIIRGIRCYIRDSDGHLIEAGQPTRAV